MLIETVTSILMRFRPEDSCVILGARLDNLPTLIWLVSPACKTEAQLFQGSEILI